MHTFHRLLYRLLLRLHPAAFRNEFARDMSLDFEDALHTFGLARLFLDATGSLARQWSTRFIDRASGPITAPRSSLLAGNYLGLRDQAFTPFELGRGLIASATLLALCLLALSSSIERTRELAVVYASSKVPATSSPANLGTRSAATLTLTDLAQTAQLKPELLLFHPSGPLPSYEVATIKPLDPDAAGSLVRLPPGVSLSPLSIRRYIMNAYAATYPPQVVGGPDWLNKDAYIINGKVPDDLQSALLTMSREERTDQLRILQQSLLADRFHLQAHFETRVLPVYELVPARGGLKLTEVPAPPQRKPGDPAIILPAGNPLPPGTLMTARSSNGLIVLKGRAIKMLLLARTIGYEIGDRPIVDHTGFTGYFDITGLTWTPLTDAAATAEPDAPPLNSAIEETLGLKLVPAKDPIQILVIDHIERPTPN